MTSRHLVGEERFLPWRYGDAGAHDTWHGAQAVTVSSHTYSLGEGTVCARGATWGCGRRALWSHGGRRPGPCGGHRWPV